MLSGGFRICIIGGEGTPYVIDIEIPGGAVSTAEIATPGAKSDVAEAACGTLAREFAFEPGLPITAVATGGWPDYSYSWKVTTPGGATTIYTDPILQHTFAEPGTHTVAITLGDRSTYTATASLAIEVSAPAEFDVTIVVNPPVPSVGQRFAPTAVVTGAPEGVPLRYVWDRGDQVVESDDPTLEIRPDVAGFVNIGVSVIDDQDGVSVGAFRELEIVAIAPLALVAAGPDRLAPGDTATFEIDLTGGVTIDETGEDLFYELTVDFGDGAVEVYEIPSPGALIEHLYPDAGRYPVTLTATSSDGQTATASLTVQVAAKVTVPVAVNPAGGASSTSPTWTGNTYYIECYGLGDDAESPERGELRLIGTQSVAFNFSGTHAAGDFSADAFDALDVEDFRLAVTGDGAYTATTLTGYIFLDYTTNLFADPEGDTCASMTVTYDFQILTASPIPVTE